MPGFDDYKIVNLATPPISLEPLCASHAEELFAGLTTPSQYEFLPQDPPVSLAAVQDRYQRWESRRSPSGDELWLNWLVRENETAAGLMQATCTTEGRALLAYQLFVPFQRRGIAAKAVGLMLNHLQSSVGITTVRALVDTRNAHSIRLLERLGFAKKRLIKDADHFKGAASHEFEYELDLTPPPKQ